MEGGEHFGDIQLPVPLPVLLPVSLPVYIFQHCGFPGAGVRWADLHQTWWEELEGGEYFSDVQLPFPLPGLMIFDDFDDF